MEDEVVKRQWSKTNSDLSLRELAEQSVSRVTADFAVSPGISVPSSSRGDVIRAEAVVELTEICDRRRVHQGGAPGMCFLLVRPLVEWERAPKLKKESGRYAEANCEEDYMDDFEDYSEEERCSSASSRGQNWLSFEELEVLRQSMATLNIMGWTPSVTTSCEGQESANSAQVVRQNLALPANPATVSGETHVSKTMLLSQEDSKMNFPKNGEPPGGDPLDQTHGNLEMLSFIAVKAKELDSEQKRALSKVLRKLKTAIDSGQALSELLSDMPGVPAVQSSGREKPPPGCLKHQSCQQEIVIQLMSSHNGGSEVGLTEVELLDETGSSLPIQGVDVTIEPPVASISEPSVLANKKTRTINARDMWKGRLDVGGGHVGIRIRTPAGSKMVDCVQLWNYNVSLKGLGKGVKHCQVFVDGSKLWSGEVRKGCGNTTFDYSTRILVGKSKSGLRSETTTNAHTTHGSEGGPPSETQGSLDCSELSHWPSEQPTRDPEAFLSEAYSGSEPPSEVGAFSDQDLLAELHRRKIVSGDPDIGIKPTSLSNSSVRESGTTSPAGPKPETGNPQARKPQTGEEAICMDHPRMVSRRTTSSARRLGGQSPSFGQGVSPSVSDVSLSPHAVLKVEQPSRTAEGDSHDSSGPIWLGGIKPNSAPQLHSEPRCGARKMRPISGRRASKDSNLHGSPQTQEGVESMGKMLEGHPASKASGGRRGQKERTLEESLDSITFFQRNQAGRLNKPPSKAVQPIAPEAAALPPSTLELDDTFKDAREVMENAVKNLGLRFGGASEPPTPATGNDHSDPEKVAVQAEAHLPESSIPDVQGAPEGKPDEHPSGLATNVALVLQSAPNETPATPEPHAFYCMDIPLEFAIPLMPAGRILEIRILSTWGDPHYVGLSGIEVFDSKGKMVVIEDAINQVSAVPESINVLDEYDDDPRTPDNLVDGVSMTCDDVHVWLSPFTPDTPNVIRVDFGRQTALGLVRIWNYNKSRVHTSRGARDVCLTLDGCPIFAGEVGRAPGTLADAPSCAENILFTEDEGALQAIDEFDERYGRAVAGVRGSAQDELCETPKARHPVELVTGNDKDDPLGKASAIPDGSSRPFTSALQEPPNPDLEAQVRRLTHAQASISSKHTPPNPPLRSIHAREIKLEILDTWGDQHYVGLTGIAMVDPKGAKKSFAGAAINGIPRDLNDIPGNTGDDRTLDKLLDGVNATSDDSHMWIAPIRGVLEQNDSAPPNEITITSRGDPFSFVQLVFWNYNKNLEDTYRGAKRVHLYINGDRFSPEGGIILRKAPGMDTFDFGQIVDLSIQGRPLAYDEDEVVLSWVNNTSNPGLAQKIRRKIECEGSHSSLVRQMYITPLLPMGFVLKIVIVSSWGDAEYVGLCGLEVHDALKGKLEIDPNHLFARPHSVCDLPKMKADVRTPDKLIDGDNSGNPAHSWLAPKSFDNQPNVVVILFNTPIMLSLIKIWNYVRTPERGASRMDIFLDDALVYAGGVKKASANPSGDFAQSILFTNDEGIVKSERHSIYDGGERDTVQMMNVDRGLEAKAKRHPLAGERPGTALIRE